MAKLYPSSVHFAVGRQSLGEYASSCPRKIFVGMEGIREPGGIPQYYADIGNLWESTLELRLDDYPNSVIREKVMQYQLSENLLISGRIDFHLGDRIVEAKATSSVNGIREIKKGHYKASHLAQLCIYLMAEELTDGYLHYGFFDGYKIIGERVFKVDLSDVGCITVDGSPSVHSFDRLLDFLTTAVEVAERRVILGRPAAHHEYRGPCSNCPLKTTCDRWDNNSIRSVDEFLNNAKLAYLGVT